MTSPTFNTLRDKRGCLREHRLLAKKKRLSQKDEKKGHEVVHCDARNGNNCASLSVKIAGPSMKSLHAHTYTHTHTHTHVGNTELRATTKQ